jgi:hypothetical protein
LKYIPIRADMSPRGMSLEPGLIVAMSHRKTIFSRHAALGYLRASAQKYHAVPTGQVER